MKQHIMLAALSFVAWSAGAQTSANHRAVGKPGYPEPSDVILPELQLQGPTQTKFATLVGQVGLSGGVALQNEGCSNRSEGSVSVPAGTTLDSALRQVAMGRAKSEWQVQDGVANLLPLGGPPSLLQVRIRWFEWDREASVREVIARLRQLPEVREAALKLGLAESPIEGGASTMCIRDCEEEPKPVATPEVDQNATLFSILNHIVQAHGRAVWGYSEYHCERGALFSLDVLQE